MSPRALIPQVGSLNIKQTSRPRIRSRGDTYYVSSPTLNQSASNDTFFLPGFMSDTSNNGTLVQTVQIDVLQEMCIVTFNSFYRVGRDQKINAPETNLQSTAEDCCAACSRENLCNAWQWCSSDLGCAMPETNITFPHLGCQLLKIASFSPYVQGFSALQQGPPALPFIAGAPFNMTLPQIPGYSLNPGTDLGGLFDFPCPASSVAESCMVLGTAQELGKLCILEELCQAFIFFPDGVAFDGSGPVGILKSSGNAQRPLKASDLKINPTGATYIRDEDSVDGGNDTAANGEDTDSNGSNSSTVIGAVVGSVVGVALIAILVGLLVIARRKYSKMAAAVATSNAELEKRSNSGSDQGMTSASGSGFGGSSGPNSSNNYSGPNSDAGSSDKALHRQDSPPYIIDISSDGGISGNDVDSFSNNRLNGSYGLGNTQLERIVVVSEMPTQQRMATSGNGGSVVDDGSHGGRGMPPGSSARELLEAFSQMYAHRPPVDYVKLAEMLEDDEAMAAVAREEAQEESYRESETTMSNPSRLSSLAEEDDVDDDLEEECDLATTAAAMRKTSPPPSSSANSRTNLSVPPQEGCGTNSTPAPVSQEGIDAWALQPEDVEVCRRPDGSWWQLGTGAFGTVYKGLYCGKDNVAIKVLHRLEEPRHTEAFAREVALLKTLRDRHIVQFLGACLNGPQGTAMLITELMELGDLWRALPARDGHGDRIFSWNRRGKRVMQDVARGLRYLHSKRIVHFDLKSANILLSRAGTAKLADIGMARVLHKSYLSMVSSGLGTFAWSAPEVLAGRRCGCKADVYSWGVVLWEVCTGEAPVRGVMRPLDPHNDAVPVQVIDLYTRCVAENPDERPTADEILKILENMG
jgi:Protein tyrosine and serine/threonine kinase/PAN domain